MTAQVQRTSCDYVSKEPDIAETHMSTAALAAATGTSPAAARQGDPGGTMKVWHDDLRPPPNGWVWVRTNTEARAALLTGNVDVISLDHDMGLHTLDPNAENMSKRGFDEDNGQRLVEWMVREELVPKVVRIHSWNVEGAKRMYMHLNEHGYDCEYEAYTP